MKVLLVDMDAQRAAALERELGPAARVVTAQDGFYALTMIERNRPDIVLISDRTEGLSALDVASIVRSDPALAGVRVGMISSAGESGFTDRDPLDLMLPSTLAVADMAVRIRRVIVEDSGPRRLVPQRAPQQEKPAADGHEESLSGSLSVLNLLDLAQVLSNARKSGRLTFDFSGVEAAIFLAEGRVMEATFGGRTGKEAFAEVLRQGELSRSAAFRFEPLSRIELFGVPRRIDMTVQELLLIIAVDADETDPHHRKVQR